MAMMAATQTAVGLGAGVVALLVVGCVALYLSVRRH